MRQNPMMSSRVQVGGRPMPSWFSASLVNQSRATMSTPPPLPVEPPPSNEESEYEEIDHFLRNKNTGMRRAAGGRRACNLCGNPNPVVSCEMCDNQIFCGSCNDMYHRHPKRLHHARKILECLENRPPLPPKTFLNSPPVNEISAALPPVPPPRRNKRFGMRSATSSPTTTRKTVFDPMGSIKRFVGGMGQRPLPPPPKSGPPLPPKSFELGRAMTPTLRRPISGDRRHSSPQPQQNIQTRPSEHRSRHFPHQMMETQNPRNQSVSVSNLSNHHSSSRENGFNDWEDEEDYFARQRAHSISASHANSRYPASSHDVSHFATLQRPKRGSKAPERPPPPVPPRNFSSQSQLGFQSSQSAFNLNQMGMAPQFGMPWNYPGQGYPFDYQQQAAMMGYPGTMRRTPSNSSMGGGPPQQFFGWGPMGFGPPMSQQEMEMEILAARRGSEPPIFGNQRPHSVTQSQPVTPQGSFRKKTRPSINQDRQAMAESNRNERFIQSDQIKQRPSTPSSFARVKPSGQIHERNFHAPSQMPNTSNEFDSSNFELETTEEPEGPWTCEHCTFINPKSTKVCTICCKTPSDGYRCTGQAKSNYRRKESTGSINDDIPVVKSKLSISRGEKQQATINLVEHIERVSPTSHRSPKPRVIQFSQSQISSNPGNNEYEEYEDQNEERIDDQELERQAQRHQIRFDTKKPIKTLATASQLSNSNEDVYGSVPVQALTISPKIEIRRPQKTVTTGVGSSPPKLTIVEKIVGTSPPNNSQLQSNVKQNKTAQESKSFPSKSQSRSSDSNDNSAEDKTRKSSKSGSTTKNTKNDKVNEKGDNMMQQNNSISAKQPVTSTVSTAIQADTGESSNESGANNSSSSSGSGFSISPSNTGNRSEESQPERKSSKGTSPPPQSISTQTYDELPASTMRQQSQQSMSKTSNTSMQSLQSDDYSPPKPVEMSEKALRYARKAQHHNQAKLKRSMSTHLTSAAEPWVDTTGDGRHLYRSSSRHSLMSDTRSLPLSGPPSRDTSPPSRGGRFYEDFKRFAAPSWDRFPTPEDYFASLEDLVSRRRRDSVRSQEFELTRLLKDAEEYNYTPEDVQVALRMCGERNPIKWLQENWSSMIETVQTLATKYGREKGHENNQIGTISSTEAKDALRTHKGNVWAAVTECVEQRRKKFLELQSRGTFLREDILTALTANHGNLDAAYVELSKAQLKPFLMRIWGPPAGLDNDAVPPNSTTKNMDMEPLLSKVEKVLETEESELKSTSKVNLESSNKLDQSVERSSKVDPVEELKVLELGLQKSTEHGSEILELKQLEPEPRLEMLVSNATKVTQEIEKALQELKLSKNNPVESKDSVPSFPLKSESEPELNPNIPIHSIKSDEGEDESFADAVSDSDVNAASPNLEEQYQIEMDQEDEEEYDEDIIEIEIDDSEVSEFIQNYEVVPVRPLLVLNPSESEEKANVSKNTTNELPTGQQALESEMAEGSKSNINPLFPQDQSRNESPQALAKFVSTNFSVDNTDSKNLNRLSSTEIEQLLNTLTTTFTEMGQFATEIKAKIATEIQQQLAIAVNSVSVNANEISDPIIPGELQGLLALDTESVEPLYEPVLLPESIIENVDKKIAKYKRLAAKKQQKSSRHKSPESRVSGKEASASPSPALSTSNVSLPDEVPGVSSLNPDLSLNSPNYTNAEIKIVENHDQFSNSSDLENSLPSGSEVENDSESDSADSSEEFLEDKSVEEEIGELEEEDLESKISSEEIEVEDVSEDAEGEEVYEEVEITNSSDYDLYSNKDTDKLITNAGSHKVSFTTPTAETALTETENSGEDEDIKSFQLELSDSNKPKTELEIKVARLMNEGKTETVEKAGLAMKLMDMNFGEEDSIYAANECSSLYAALSFLQQECDLCAGKFCARQMVSMLRCTHVCCRSCAKEYFTVQIRDKTIIDATCPFCSEPSNLSDEPELATDYFTHLEILLKSFLESHIHEMFQRKLRDWALAKTPNFKWCSKCSSGFITEPLQTRLICPDCNAVTCAICLDSWDKFNHDHRESKVKVCDSSSKSIVDYLNENSIECTRCHFRFALARGGCMHLTCTQCRHEFCSGCSAPFRMGDKCEAKLPVCDRLGLHAHHPRNCLFYLRDKEPEILCKLLEENAIPYLKESSGANNQDVSAQGTSKTPRECQVPIQKETPDGLKDDICGKDAPTGYATVCIAHYVEYLGLLIWQNHLDPISILSSDDLEVIIRRAYKKHPGRPYPTSDDEFRNRLLRVIQEEIPL